SGRSHNVPTAPHGYRKLPDWWIRTMRHFPNIRQMARHSFDNKREVCGSTAGSGSKIAKKAPEDRRIAAQLLSARITVRRLDSGRSGRDFPGSKMIGRRLV